MISRRILRIKIMQLLFAYFKSEGASINHFEKQLLFSVNKTYDLYHFLILLVIDICDYSNSRIELARVKQIPTQEDLNPNTKFINNQVIQQLRTNQNLIRYLGATKLSWVNHPELVKNLYNNLYNSDFFKDYMNDTKTSYEEDKKLVTAIYTDVIAQSEQFFQSLEEQSIFWNDEVEFVLSMIIKTINLFKKDQDENAPLLSLYKNEEDREFVKNLFRKVVLNNKEYHLLIEEFTQNWDIDRIAFMDILLMEMAIAEAIEFPSIPTKVTFNEYLEIAKYYSTNKSSVFINGILDRIFQKLKQENKIKKQGRGLIGEV